MTSYTLSPVWGAGAQLFDNSGNVLTGGKIETYEAGTTTPAPTYTTPIGNVFNSNPIVADASGRLSNEIWLQVGGAYKFVLKDANNVLIATYDNIPTIPQPPIVNDASSISYEQGYTVTAGAFTVGATYRIASVGTTNFIAIGAAANIVGILFTATGVGSGNGTAEYSRTVQAKLRESVSVKDFGAVGNGVADDTVAIQAAMSSGAKGVYFPQGTYKVTAQITVPPNVTVTGAGVNGTIIDGTTVPSGYIFLFGDTPVTLVGTISSGTIGQPSFVMNAGPTSTVNKNDTVIIWNPTTFSWSAARSYYRQGEFCRVESVSGATINIAGALFDTYASPSEVYLMANDANSLSDMTILAPKDSTISSAGAVSFRNLVAGSLQRVWVYGGINTSVTTVRCTNFNILACRLDDNLINDAGDDYPLSLANCQNICVTDCFVTSQGSHAITMGGSGDTATPVTRNIKVSNCTISARSGYSADTHGDCEFITYDNCMIEGGALLAGDHITISNCQIRGQRVGLFLIRVYEMRGFNFSFINNYIEPDGVFASALGIGIAVPGDAVSTGSIVFSDNSFNCLSTSTFQINCFTLNTVTHSVIVQNNDFIYPSGQTGSFAVVLDDDNVVPSNPWDKIIVTGNNFRATVFSISRFAGGLLVDFVANSAYFANNNQDGCVGASCVIQHTKNVSINSNYISDSVNNAVNVNGGGAITATRGDVCEVSGNIFVNNVTNAPAIAFSADSDVTVQVVESVSIFGNTHINTNATKPRFFAFGTLNANVYLGNYAGMYTPSNSLYSFASATFSNGSILFGSKTYDPPSLNDGDGTTTTVTVTGAALGDYADNVSFSNDLQGITVTGWVSAANTVSVRFQNETGGVVDLASGTLRALVRKA
jgi:hypothetical protein